MAASTVINAAYDTSGNGGRKVVRLSNGWIVVAMHVAQEGAPQIYFYVSKNNGLTFSILCWTTYSSAGTTLVGFALASKGTNVYSIASYSNGAVRKLSFDSTTVPNGNQIDGPLDSSQTSCGSGCSLTINTAGTELHAAWSSKNGTYPNSFNIRYAKGTIDGSGNVTWGSITQVTTVNNSGNDYKNPTVVLKNNGYPTVITEYAATGVGTYRIYAYNFNGSSWGGVFVYDVTTHLQYNPCAVVDGNGVIHVVWHGKDATDSSNENIRYSKSTDGGATWSTAIKLTSGNTYYQVFPTISVDNKNNLYVFFYGTLPTSSWEQIRKVEYKGTSWSSVTTLTNNTSKQAWKPSAMEKESGSMIGWIWQDMQAPAVKFDSITLNQAPTLTLTNPSDNQTLSEGNTMTVQGTATDPDANDPVTIYLQINNGTILAVDSKVSDGATAIPFAKILTYKNKRVYSGTTDLVGVDLAENTDQTLKVWAEDNKQGKSTEVIRKFRVIWNRPPLIDGQNKDLGTMEVPPVENYTVTEPESNPFTVTEKINGVVIRTFPGVAGRQESITIPKDLWLRLEPGVQHTLTIEATDNQGMSSTRTFTLKRFVNKIVFNGMDFNVLDTAIRDKFTTDVAAKRILLTPIWDLPPGTNLLVEVCNNAYDAVPTWEDATIVVKLNRAHLFANTTKTADKWGINFRFRIEKGTAILPVYFKGVGGAFD